jgi:hypothetical protein
MELANRSIRILATPPPSWQVNVRQVTSAAHGHLLTNIGCWSADSLWVHYDVRSDLAGTRFDGTRIERVRITDGCIESIYESRHGACCGVVTCSPSDPRVVFIEGPEHPTKDFAYSAWNRCGVLIDPSRSRKSILDARCLAEPLVEGALRGGSHVHTFDPRGEWIAFTYEDFLLASSEGRDGFQKNQRNVGVSVPGRAVHVHAGHPRNHSGSRFSVLVTRTWDYPEPGSDQLQRAYEDAWIGTAGYYHPDGTPQVRAVAFLGDLCRSDGTCFTELFVVDLPEDLTVAGENGPLAGTMHTRPNPPRGVFQRRLTFTADRAYPGVQGPRHWPRSSPDGTKIATLMRDAAGTVQIWIVSPNGGETVQLTWNEEAIQSAFSFSPDGKWIAHIAGGSVCVTEVATGMTTRLTSPPLCRGEPAIGFPRPEACVFSPSGERIAYMMTVGEAGSYYNQIFVIEVQLPG